MTKAAWLHWIRHEGKRVMTTVDFLGEARRLGILLPVSLLALGSMSWKDEVYCIHRQKRNKRGSVFCRFPISVISGLAEDAMEELVESFAVKAVNEGGAFRERISGDYLEGNTWNVSASLQEIYATLKKLKQKKAVGSLMLGCAAEEFSVLEVPWARLAQVKYSPGFRPFMADQFMEDAERYKKCDIFQATFKVRLESAYLADTEVTGISGGNIQCINRYAELDGGLDREQLELFA